MCDILSFRHMPAQTLEPTVQCQVPATDFKGWISSDAKKTMDYWEYSCGYKAIIILQSMLKLLVLRTTQFTRQPLGCFCECMLSRHPWTLAQPS